MPMARTSAPATIAEAGSVATSVRQPTRPATASNRGHRRSSDGSVERGQVRDGVVREHGDAGEADGVAHVDGRREHDEDQRDGQLGAQWDRPARVDVGVPPGELRRRAMARMVRETPGISVSSTPSAANPAPMRTIGATTFVPPASTTRTSGASVVASWADGTVANVVTPTTA